MADTDSNPFVLFPEIHDEIEEFVEDLVRYVLEFMDTEEPPHVSYRPSAFTNNIGKTVLKVMRHNDPVSTNYLQQFISRCLSMPVCEMKQIKSDITVFLSEHMGLEAIIPPHSYFVLFLKACVLCVGFSEVQRKDCIQVTKGILKDLLRELETEFCDFCDVDKFAAEIMNPSNNRS